MIIVLALVLLGVLAALAAAVAKRSGRSETGCEPGEWSPDEIAERAAVDARPTPAVWR